MSYFSFGGTTEENFLSGWAPLERLGCSYERANRVLIAIDVPLLVDAYAVHAQLEKIEDAGIWRFAEGHCGHSLRRGDVN